MNMQQGAQSKPSANGFGRRKQQTAKSNSSRLTSVGKGGGFESSSRDRLFYITACLIGHQVEVQVLDGSVFSGILHATNADKDFDIVLKMARLIKDGSRGQKSASESLSKPASKTFIIPAKELVQVTSKGVHLTPDDVKNEYQREKQLELMTDSCISQFRHADVERELERWVPDEDAPDCPDLDNIFDGQWNRGWNQFEVNETLFGVKSTFNEELYTTKLEKGPQTRDLEREALRIAREIEGEETHDLHLADERGTQFHGNLDVDEETLYSSVYRRVDDSGCDDGEDILLGSQNRETFQDISSSVVENSFTSMSSKKSNDGAQEPSQTSSMDGALFNVDNQTKQPLQENDKRPDEIQTSGQTKDFGNQLQAGEGHAVLKPEDSNLSHEAKNESSDKSDLSSDATAVTSLSEVHGKIKGMTQSANSCTHTSAVSTSDGGGTASSSAATGLLSKSSSLSSSTSEKSSLNPHAKEFKLNPNAKSFVPSTSPLRPASPVSDGAYYYQPSVAPVQHIHAMPVGVGIGPSYAGHQPVMFNPQVAPVPQPYYPPNGPQYGQQMMVGHPRQVVYMPTYPPEMPYRRDY